MRDSELAETEWLKWKKGDHAYPHVIEAARQAFLAGYRAAFENYAVDAKFNDSDDWGGCSMSVTRREWE